MKFTPRQTEVMANLPLIATDGARHEPQFRLGEKNVTVQVRSLLNHGVIVLENGRLATNQRAVAMPPMKATNTASAVGEMRDFLLGDI